MGKHNIKYLIMMALEKKARIGSSKVAARKAQGKRNPDGIYGLATLHDYKRWARYYANWLRREHPEVRTLDEAAKYTGEYIACCIAAGKSPYTIAAYRAAFAKIFGADIDTPPLPPRLRDGITKSREEAARDAEFNEAAHRDLVDAARGTGCRREDLAENVHAGGFYTGASGTLYYHVIGGKGGRDRQPPVLPEYRDAVKRIVKDALERGGPTAHLFEHVSGKADIHGYRRDYAQRLYALCDSDHAYRDMLYAEMDVASFAKPGTLHTERYHCRGSATGISYDRKSLQIVAVALGHGAGREGTIVNHYLLDTPALRSRSE